MAYINFSKIKEEKIYISFYLVAMENEDIEDILLSLLIYRVDNGDAWINRNHLKMRVLCDNFEELIKKLKEEGYVEFRDDDYLRITKKGIDFIVERV